jgi:hypothetical protein
MPLLVTSAAGANGNGYGSLLAFDLNGRPVGAFSGDSRIADPRGLAVDRNKGLLFLNSGTDRVLALDPNGSVVRDSGPIEGLNPGGGNFGAGRPLLCRRAQRAYDHGLFNRAWRDRRVCPPGRDSAISPRICVRS